MTRERIGPRERLAARRAERLLLRHPSHELGIPRILGRRARWVGARLRHPRG